MSHSEVMKLYTLTKTHVNDGKWFICFVYIKGKINGMYENKNKYML